MENFTSIFIQKELISRLSGIWTCLANINMWVKFLSRHSEVFKIYTKYLSCIVCNQVYNMFVCTLRPCLSSFPQKTEANYSEIPARSTCHKSRGSAITCRVEIALHNMTHRETRWVVKKNSISNLHIVGMPLEWAGSLKFSYFAVLTTANLWSRLCQTVFISAM